MNLKEYQDQILDAEKEDWNRIACWGSGSGPSYFNKFVVWNTGGGEFSNIKVDSHDELISLKSDLSISVAWGISHNDDFKEKWANGFPDPHASSGYVDFFYYGQLVYRDIYVTVDGGRCQLPLPQMVFNRDTNDIEKLTVAKDKYHFFRLLNSLITTYDYDSYFERAGLEIVDTSWMA